MKIFTIWLMLSGCVFGLSPVSDLKYSSESFELIIQIIGDDIMTFLSPFEIDNLKLNRYLNRRTENFAKLYNYEIDEVVKIPFDLWSGEDYRWIGLVSLFLNTGHESYFDMFCNPQGTSNQILIVEMGHWVRNSKYLNDFDLIEKSA